MRILLSARRRNLVAAAIVGSLASWLGIADPAIVHAQATPVPAGGLGMTRSVPPPAYFSNFVPYNNGDYKDALKGFQGLLGSGSIKTSTSRWIDSICLHAMCGECYYHMGKYPDALLQYNNAVQLFLSFSD